MVKRKANKEMPIISDIGFIANYVARKFSLRSTGKKDLKV